MSDLMSAPLFCKCGRKFGALEEQTRVCVRCGRSVDPLPPEVPDDDRQEVALRRYRTPEIAS